MNFKSLYKEYKENHLFWLMFVLFFFLWLVSTVIFTAICMSKGISITEGSLGAYANILVFDATIFAPIAAYFFYDNWKDQKNYDLNKEILLEVDSVLYSIYDELGKYSRRVIKLKDVENYKIELEGQNENKRFIHPNKINELESKCSLFDTLNNTNINILQYNFCLVAFRLGIVLEKIYVSYDKYSAEINSRAVDLTITSSYKKDERSKLNIEINDIKYTINKKYEFHISNENNSVNSIYLTFDELNKEFVKTYNDFRDEIIRNIKL